MHSHDFIEICLVAEGTGVHYIDNQQMQVARGDMLFIPIGVSHVFRPKSTSKGGRDCRTAWHERPSFSTKLQEVDGDDVPREHSEYPD